MSIFGRLRMWWYRRILHQECLLAQVWIWGGGSDLDVPHGACGKCLPRMEWMREQMTATARLLP